MKVAISNDENGYGTRDIINKENGKKTSLPHGSGIDATWNVERTKNHIICRNSYHCLNEAGFYDGWIDFSLKVPKEKPEDFAQDYDDMLDEITRAGMSILDGIIR